MAEFVAILEDDAVRIAAMQPCLAELLPTIEPVFFEDAQAMIAWLRHHLVEVVLISLDHDLPLHFHAGRSRDYGTGREVADFLASLPPTCPVIVHSSNVDRANGMFFALKNAGWPCSRVYPCDDVAWVAAAWSQTIEQHLRDGWIKCDSRNSLDSG